MSGRDFESQVNVSEFREFPGDPELCAVARALVRTTLTAFADVVEYAELAASELFGNAVKHTASGEGGTLSLSVCGMANGMAMVSVADQGPKLADVRAGRRPVPRTRPLDPDAIGFRGLHLVAAFCSDWGFWNNEEGGLTVWTLFQHPDRAPLTRIA